MTKILLPLFLIAAALGGGYYYYQSHVAKTATTQPATTSYTVARGNIFQAVASTGRVVSNLDVEIKCKASGQIIELPYTNVSQKVTKGSLIVQVDPVDQQRAVRQAQVALGQSQAKLDQAKQNLAVAEQTLVTARMRNDTLLKSSESNAKDAKAKAQRRRELFEQKLTSPEELQAAETAATMADAEFQNAKTSQAELKTQELALEVKRKDVKLAEAMVENDQIALETTKQRLSDTTVLAPMDGVVATLNVQRGKIIGSGVTNVGGGDLIMVLSDLSQIFVLASVDESDIGKVAVGQDASVTADAFPGQSFKGKVVNVAAKGVNISNVVTFEVRVEIVSENKGLLKPEMTANVQIVIASKKDVLVTPVTGVSRKGGKTLAAVQKPDGTTEDRPVQVGLTDGEKYEIVSGLSEGDVITLRKDETPSKWREGGGQGQRQGGGATGMFGPGGGRR
jgi:HlyD family secretion protein